MSVISKRTRSLMLAFVSVVLCADQSFAGAVEATRPLRSGTVIEIDDVVITARTARRGEAESLDSVIGMQVRSSVHPGRGIRLSNLSTPVLVRRNQLVELVYRAGTLAIRAEGRAMNQGGKGERVRVMNLDSRITITGRVSSSGVVEVVR